jgi:hypothetical protein
MIAISQSHCILEKMYHAFVAIGLFLRTSSVDCQYIDHKKNASFPSIQLLYSGKKEAKNYQFVFSCRHILTFSKNKVMASLFDIFGTFASNTSLGCFSSLDFF